MLDIDKELYTPGLNGLASSVARGNTSLEDADRKITEVSCSRWGLKRNFDQDWAKTKLRQVVKEDLAR